MDNPQPVTPPQPVPQQVVVPPEPPKQSKPTKIIILVLVIALLGTGAIALYLWQKTTTAPVVTQLTPSVQPSPLASPVDEAANWKTYTNTMGMYQISYPTSWTAKALVANTPNAELLPTTQIVQLLNNETASITIQKFTGQQPYDPSTEALFGNLYSATSTQKTFDKNGNISQAFAVINKSDNSYIKLELNYPSNLEAQVYQILSTFTFTDSAASVDTSNWKTYTNSVYKYEILFPPELKLAEASYDGRPATNLSSGITIGKQGEAATIIIQYVGMTTNPLATKETTLAGLKAYMVESENIQQDVYYINIPDTDQFLEIYADKEVNKVLAGEILSTFKFTK